MVEEHSDTDNDVQEELDDLDLEIEAIVGHREGGGVMRGAESPYTPQHAYTPYTLHQRSEWANNIRLSQVTQQSVILNHNVDIRLSYH